MSFGPGIKRVVVIAVCARAAKRPAVAEADLVTEPNHEAQGLLVRGRAFQDVCDPQQVWVQGVHAITGRPLTNSRRLSWSLLRLVLAWS